METYEDFKEATIDEIIAFLPRCQDFKLKGRLFAKVLIAHRLIKFLEMPQRDVITTFVEEYTKNEALIAEANKALIEPKMCLELVTLFMNARNLTKTDYADPDKRKQFFVSYMTYLVVAGFTIKFSTILAYCKEHGIPEEKATAMILWLSKAKTREEGEAIFMQAMIKLAEYKAAMYNVDLNS